MELKPNKSELAARIEGTFEIKCRSGVAPHLSAKTALEWRIAPVTLRGGAWNGFAAYPAGVDGMHPMEEFFPKLPAVISATFVK